MTQFKVNLSDRASPLPHHWEFSLGSGNASLALRADWQEQVARCKRELGVKHIRFHGVLSDFMGTLIEQNNQLVYSFFRD